MSCSCAKYDSDSGYYNCEVSGDSCVFMFPNSKACAEKYGEGPDAYPDQVCENCKGFRMIDGKRGCASTWGRCTFDHEIFLDKPDENGLYYRPGIVLSDGSALIDDDTTSCGGFKKI